ncbi:MAG: AI-2E family transporter [Acetobacteraceae bacterium]|nr:AI-2E family transporter [Acetobacteraceae bacterium]
MTLPRVPNMAEQDSETKGRARREPISGLFAMVAVLVAATIIAILYFGREVVVPITLAVLLSFLLAPAVRWLRRLRLGRIAAVGLTVLIAFLALAGFAAILVEEVSSLAQELPEYRSNLETKIRSLPGVAPGDGVFGRAAHVLQELGNELRNSGSQQAASSAGASSAAAPASMATKPVPVQIQEPEPGPLQIVQDIVGPLLQPLAAAGLVVVFVILILIEREDLRDRLLRLAGRDLHRTTEAMNDAAERISRYLLSQLIVNFTCGVPIGLGLAVIGIPNAALWGALVVLLRFIPYLGIVIAAAFPLALAIAVSPGWMLLVWTGLLFVGIETIVANIVEPFVYGGSTGVSPVALIAAATFWTWLWGPIGLLLSTPMTVCLVVLGRHVPQLQFFEVILGNEPVLSPEERFYQRLLAKDPEEATEQVEAFAKERPLADFFDEVALTALARAQADSDRGALSVQNRSHFKETIAALVENLSEDEGEGSTAVPAAPPKTGASGVVCVAGRNDLDEAAALLLAHLLNRERRLNTGPPLPPDTLSSDAAHFPLLKGASVACLSLISTSSPARARYLVRRIRRRAPGASVIVCFWGWAGGENPPDEISAATSADAVAFSLREAIANIDKMPMAQRTSVRAM